MYDQQLQTLLDKGFARELEDGELESWKARGGSYYYMAHQMVVDPSNKSTSIRRSRDVPSTPVGTLALM